MAERKAAKKTKKSAKKSARKSTRKKRGLGAGAKSLELDRPMGEALGSEVEAPPPPPPREEFEAAPEAVADLSDEVDAEAAPPARDEPAPEPEPLPEPAHEPEPIPEPEKPPMPAFDAPPEPAPAAAPSLADVNVDLDLLPWIVKKQLALDTDREDLDYEIYFWIEGKTDRLVLEGHRSDFGKLYVVGPQTPPGCWRRYSQSEFAGTPVEEVFQTYRNNIVSVLVRTPGLEIEFSDLADFLEWSNY